MRQRNTSGAYSWRHTAGIPAGMVPEEGDSWSEGPATLAARPGPPSILACATMMPCLGGAMMHLDVCPAEVPPTAIAS